MPKAFDTPCIDTSSKALFATAPICTKLVITKKYYIEINLMEFHANCSGIVIITDITSFTLLSNTRLPLHRFSRNARLVRPLRYQRIYTQNFISFYWWFSRCYYITNIQTDTHGLAAVTRSPTHRQTRMIYTLLQDQQHTVRHAWFSRCYYITNTRTDTRALAAVTRSPRHGQTRMV